jgi:DNA-binding beta-propeller fold protein YncE
VTAAKSPGALYSIDPLRNPGQVITHLGGFGDSPEGITIDGSYIWTANTGGSVSRFDLDGNTLTISITMGFSSPRGILFDGVSLWVTDVGDNMLKRLDSNGNVAQNVPVGGAPAFPVFDGSNIWVPNSNDSTITVVRARDGMVLATLAGNGLKGPAHASFDGERILVTNFSGNSLSLWKASDMTPIGNIPTFSAIDNPGPWGVCSDGINFWITLLNTNELLRL